ncbi:pteridine transporter [Leishmania donovani]|uniref:Pteridine_transporter_(Truncated)_-_putative n=3 Tax=Leishmania donovani species complex TaxID=38574 RepID=A0A6L0WJ46_LEIIN|nr:putative pteridine transporter [Leishmania infantum JPCM5]TPP49707.1 BT1 family protein [Leishmania donovani]CAC9447310.1 pteridine_transporter_(truncated)_-_putative [Leishmania infantum]CAJ1986230.1 pteridine transporter [Leishmania donovani]CBZ08358.1 putative pteridine transporter [Leishmania infantum JPCM5]SUZ39179.1 pteridine_transporter_(truncated)_-_putative [Leishmania infantum]|eukprot:XP_003392224.1 putative pteridine transporter [Leishmania infantum JPCM5]
MASAHPIQEMRNGGAADHREDGATEVTHAEYEHPTATKWFNAAPCLRYIPLFGEVTAAFGPKFSLSLGLCYTLSKGAASRIINVSRQPMFIVHYGLNVARYQRLATMYSLGWSLKPFIASIADVIALFGYTKRWYMALSAVLGTAAALAYALLPAKESSANAAAAFVFLTCFGKSNIDILSQGHFSRSMRENPEAGPSVVSWVWAMTFVGTILASCMMGPLSDAKLTYVGIILSAALQLATIFFFVFNMYGEKKNRTNRRKDALMQFWELKRLEKQQAAKAVDGHVVESIVDSGDVKGLAVAEVAGDSREDDDADFVEPDIGSCLGGAVEVNVDVAVRNWRLIVYALIMTCGITTQACVMVLGTRRHLLYACIGIATVFMAGAFLSLPLIVAKAAVFIYLNSLLYLQIPGALSNFYLAKPKCLPDGPHFSYTFYQTVGALITDAGGVTGAVLFTRFFSKHRYAFVFIATTLLQALGSVFDLIIVKRWNVHIGIPDHAMYILGDAIVYEICFVMSLMPGQILMSRLCPRGTETIAFALLAGFNSAGNSMSLAVGSLLMENFWPVSAKPPCNFKNVPYLIIAGHLCTPLLVIPLAFLLLPKARICDRIDIDGNVIAEDAKTVQERRCPVVKPHAAFEGEGQGPETKQGDSREPKA